MPKLKMIGDARIDGEVRIDGAKNAVLPILAATLLTNESTLMNVPDLKDVRTMLALLQGFGSQVSWTENGLEIITSEQCLTRASYELVKTMRASILSLGPLLARFGRAEVAFPGGCAIGSRPVDVHIDAMRAMGAQIVVENGFIKATAPAGLTGCTLRCDKISVTGTENIMMAAVLAKGTTTIHNAAIEPEVVDCGRFCQSMGAKISGLGTSTIVIEGQPTLTSAAAYRVMPDRIEAGTYLVAAAITRGRIKLTQVEPSHCDAVLDILRQAGADIDMGTDWISLDMHGQRAKAVGFETAPYPGVPTDMQAQLMAMNAAASGQARMHEAVFENRLMHVPEMRRLGAQLTIENEHVVVSEGTETFSAAPVCATDLRASAGLVLLALVAQGETVIDRIDHLERGYADLVHKFTQLGVIITRIADPVSAHTATYKAGDIPKQTSV